MGTQAKNMAGNRDALATIVGPVLESQFSNQQLQMFVGCDLFAVFAAHHPDVGDIEIFDDRDEVRVNVGRFTHVHFGPADDGATWRQDGERIASEVVAFLSDIFENRLKFYVTRRTGGCVPIAAKQGVVSKLFLGPHQYFVWSGPLTE